jgi:hypothetical protein
VCPGIDSKPTKLKLTVDTTFKELKEFWQETKQWTNGSVDFAIDDKFNTILDHRLSL